MDAHTDGKFNGSGGNGNAGTVGEDCTEERCNSGGEREPAVDRFADTADALAGHGIKLGEPGAGQDGDRCDHVDGKRGVHRGSNTERERIAERGNGVVERKWNLAGKWKRELDVNSDGSRISSGEFDAGDCDSDR